MSTYCCRTQPALRFCSVLESGAMFIELHDVQPSKAILPIGTWAIPAEGGLQVLHVEHILLGELLRAPRLHRALPLALAASSSTVTAAAVIAVVIPYIVVLSVLDIMVGAIAAVVVFIRWVPIVITVA